MTEKIPEKSYEEIKKLAEDLSRLNFLRLKEEGPISVDDIIHTLVYSFYNTLDSMLFQNDKLFLKLAIHSLLYIMEIQFGKDWNKNFPKYED